MTDNASGSPLQRGIRFLFATLVGLVLLFNIVATREHLLAIGSVDRQHVSAGGYTSRANVFVGFAVSRFFQMGTRFLVPPLHRVTMPALKKTHYPLFFFRLTRPYGMKFLNLFSYPIQTRIKRYNFVLTPEEFRYLKKRSSRSSSLTISQKTITAFYPDKYRNGFYFDVDFRLHLVGRSKTTPQREVGLFLHWGDSLHFVVAPLNWRKELGVE